MGLRIAKDGNGPSRSMLMSMYEADGEGTLKDNSGGDLASSRQLVVC